MEFQLWGTDRGGRRLMGIYYQYLAAVAGLERFAENGATDLEIVTVESLAFAMAAC